MYDVDFSVASKWKGAAFHLEIDGVDRTGRIGVPDTGSWQKWVTVRARNISLDRGLHVLRLVFDADALGGRSASVNWIQFNARRTAMEVRWPRRGRSRSRL